MATSLPTGTLWPSRQCHLGPFLDTDDDRFVLAIPSSSADDEIAIYKSTDPVSGSWAESDSADRPTATNATEIVRSIWGHQVGRLIHIAWATEDDSGMDPFVRVYYARFDMSTEQWVTGEATNLGGDFGGSSIAADGDMAAHCSITEFGGTLLLASTTASRANMGNDFASVGYFTKVGAAAWSGSTDATGMNTGQDYSGPVAIADANDVVHIIHAECIGNTRHVEQVQVSTPSSPAQGGSRYLIHNGMPNDLRWGFGRGVAIEEGDGDDFHLIGRNNTSNSRVNRVESANPPSTDAEFELDPDTPTAAGDVMGTAIAKDPNNDDAYFVFMERTSEPDLMMYRKLGRDETSAFTEDPVVLRTETGPERLCAEIYEPGGALTLGYCWTDTNFSTVPEVDEESLAAAEVQDPFRRERPELRW